ncbi:hypothetical protein D9M72_333820 [compost metagenome]
MDSQPRLSYSSPASGRPRALPMPSVALIRATADPIFSLGSSSRMMLMPTGIKAEENPCSARPTMSQRKLPPTAATMEPATMMARQITIIFRLPYMSALRDTIGVATALESSVAVTSQEASSAVTPRIPGKSGRSGTTRVCISATTVPLSARTAVMAPGDMDLLRDGGIRAEPSGREAATRGERTFTVVQVNHCSPRALKEFWRVKPHVLVRGPGSNGQGGLIETITLRKPSVIHRRVG